MTRYTFDLAGSGRVEIPAYGIADAESRVEKELRASLPAAVVDIVGITRADPHPRIVEEFVVSYRIRLRREEEGDDEGNARRAALRSVRGALEGTRYARMSWDKVRRPGA